MHRVGFHPDVQKMYNSVNYVRNTGVFRDTYGNQISIQLSYPKKKVIKTLIYGVKSSGNQAERGLRETAQICQDEYPEVNNIVKKDIYVDDCIFGEICTRSAFQKADELTLVLHKGGFGLKGFTFSGKPPDKDVSPREGGMQNQMRQRITSKIPSE